MNAGRKRLAAVLLGVVLHAAAFAAAPAWWQELNVKPVSQSANVDAAQWIAVVFLSPECPLANGDIPVLNELHRRFAAQGCLLVGAYSDPYLETDALVQHAHEYRIEFPTIDDRAQHLMERAGATYTPEVVVFSKAGERLYRGRIDDRVTDFQGVRPNALRHDLADVLAALVAGHAGPFKDEPGFGCTIPKPHPKR
jgi:hypothetical protein